jgi:hypothetical protein
VDEAHVSVRFKHGIHTIYLFVDTQDSMAAVGQELRSLLRERYPDGLTTSSDPPKTTVVPDEEENPCMAFAVLRVPSDPTRGWKRLEYDDEQSTKAGKAGLVQNGIVAFAFLGNEDDEPAFEVEWPSEEDDPLHLEPTADASSHR